MEPRKQAIMAALDKFVAQRPGLEFGNYGDVKAYRAEMRSITRDRHDYNTLARAVERSDSITADSIIAASRGAFCGRLTIEMEYPITEQSIDENRRIPVARITYVTGQYFPTEYRKAACAVLASALWYWMRETSLPTGENFREALYAPGNTVIRERAWKFGKEWMSAGDWLRAYFRREFGRSIANRWFS